MTWALCFQCGNTKFGAICPCENCGISSTGDIGLDIAFSDHNLSISTLKAFGEVVRALQTVASDDNLRFWTFLHYVSTRHSDVLGITLRDHTAEQLEALIKRANPPPVVCRKPSPEDDYSEVYGHQRGDRASQSGRSGSRESNNDDDLSTPAP